MPTDPDKRLPKPATLKISYALEIASNPSEVKDAYKEYWQVVFSNLGEKNNIFSAESTDTSAFTIALAIPDFKLISPVSKNKKILDLLDQHNSILRPYLNDDRAMKYVLKRSGTLVSAAEIAEALKAKNSSFEEVKKDILAFKNAAEHSTAAVNKDQVARGIRAVRELFDLTRKFIYCYENQKTYFTPKDSSSTRLFTELLALYRQEGALGITPPANSFRWGPLIHTEPNTGRVAEVSLGMNINNVERPGFNLVYKDIPDLSKPSAENTVIINMLVTGGLDSIAHSQLSDEEELIQFIRMAPGTGSKDLGHVQLCAGLVMADIEWQNKLPPIDQILSALTTTHYNLVTSHQIDSRSSPPDVYLIDNHGLSTRDCWKIAASWYASRTKPVTLIPLSQRKDFSNLPRFSPFVTYLRYHLQDMYFLILLAKYAIFLQELSQHPYWKNRKGGNSLADALAKSKWKTTGTDRVIRLKELIDRYEGAKRNQERNMISELTGYYRLLFKKLMSGSIDPQLGNVLNDALREKLWDVEKQLKKGKEIPQSFIDEVNRDLGVSIELKKIELKKKTPQLLLWQYQGFFQVLKENEKVPSWLKTEDNQKTLRGRHPLDTQISAVEDEMKKKKEDVTSRISDVAVELVKIIRDLEIMNPVCIAIEWTPVNVLKYFQILPPLEDPVSPYMKSHSFERLRTVYEISLEDAKIDLDTLWK